MTRRHTKIVGQYLVIRLIINKMQMIVVTVIRLAEG